MSVLTGMQELAERRAAKFQPIPLKTFFKFTDLQTLTWLGQYAWANQAQHSRWLKESLVMYPFDIPQLPPELARDYLRVKYTDPRRHTVKQFSAINEHRAAPLYARIGKYQDMALVDLTAAYWNITRIVGWDVDYHPGRWLGKRSDMDDFPFPGHKLMRNCLVSAGLMVGQRIWTGERHRVIKAHSSLINYDIWSLAQDVLHSLANIAIRVGAVHIHTDGWIIPLKHAERMIEECAYWGLPATIKASGDCKVKGVGAYKIGDRATKKIYHFQPHDLTKIYEPDIAWLRFRMHKFSRIHIKWER